MLRLPVLLTGICLSAAYSAAQNYPPPFPRAGAKMVLENDRLKVWDVTWPKHRPTPTHEHQFDQLSVTLVGGTVRVTRLGQPATVNKSEIGSVTFTAKGTVHVEEGLSAVPSVRLWSNLSRLPRLPHGRGNSFSSASRRWNGLERSRCWRMSTRSCGTLNGSRDKRSRAIPTISNLWLFFLRAVQYDPLRTGAPPGTQSEASEKSSTPHTAGMPTVGRPCAEPPAWSSFKSNR